LEEGGSIILDEGTCRLKPAAEHVQALKPYVGKDLVLGVRPEDLPYVEGDNANAIKAKISVVEPLVPKYICGPRLPATR
jgi:multiple sugar transport system ATP-binding protein